jgi:hypothetical protein
MIHKSKRNTNNTFSIGKTWPIQDLQALEAVNVRDLHLISYSARSRRGGLTHVSGSL